MPVPTYAVTINSSKFSSYEDDSFDEVIRERLFMPCKKIDKMDEVLISGSVLLSKRASTKPIMLEVSRNTFPLALANIEEAIEDAKSILTIEDECEGNVSVPPYILEKAAYFLRSYASHLYNIYGCILSAPNISALKNGSIDLEWNVDDASLLINVKNSREEIAFYYGEFIHNGKKFDVNGQVPTDSTISTFADWLKSLSK